MNEPGFSSVDVCRMSGVTFRQLDYWVRIGLVTPSVRQATSSGHRRKWSLLDVMLVTALGTCNPVQRKRVAAAMAACPDAGFIVVDEITGDVYACSSDDDLLTAFQSAQVASVICLAALVNRTRDARQVLRARSSV